MQHIEFIHTDYFSGYHFRKDPDRLLSGFIHHYWETDFEDLWAGHPEGFTDILFPDIGYTYLINLGTAFTIRFPGRNFNMKIDCFLPRHLPLECHHRPGNKIFGIKFRVSPHIFEKRINFSEYNQSMYSLSYLIDRAVIGQLKAAPTFAKRVDIVNKYYRGIVQQHQDELHYVNIVGKVIRDFNSAEGGSMRIEQLARKYKTDIRTLQRYFSRAIGMSPKQAMRLARIRRILKHISDDPYSVNIMDYGYYDRSHFYKDLRKFMVVNNRSVSRSYLTLLERVSLR